MVSTYTGSDGSIREAMGAELISGGKPVNMGQPVCLGEYSGPLATSTTTLAAFITAAAAATGSPATLAAAITAGATFIRVCVETNDIRVSFFGNSASVATAGELFTKGATYPMGPSDLTKIVMAAQSASATLRISIWA